MAISTDDYARNSHKINELKNYIRADIESVSSTNLVKINNNFIKLSTMCSIQWEVFPAQNASWGTTYHCYSKAIDDVAVVVVVVVLVDLGFTTLLTYQVIRVAVYSEREKSDKFCSEALISA